MLSTLPGTSMSFVAQAMDDVEAQIPMKEDASRIVRLDKMKPITVFVAALQNAKRSDGNCKFEY